MSEIKIYMCIDKLTLNKEACVFFSFCLLFIFLTVEIISQPLVYAVWLAKGIKYKKWNLPNACPPSEEWNFVNLIFAERIKSIFLLILNYRHLLELRVDFKHAYTYFLNKTNTSRKCHKFRSFIKCIDPNCFFFFSFHHLNYFSTTIC